MLHQSSWKPNPTWFTFLLDPLYTKKPHTFGYILQAIEAWFELLKAPLQALLRIKEAINENETALQQLGYKILGKIQQNILHSIETYIPNPDLSTLIEFLKHIVGGNEEDYFRSTARVIGGEFFQTLFETWIPLWDPIPLPHPHLDHKIAANNALVNVITQLEDPSLIFEFFAQTILNVELSYPYLINQRDQFKLVDALFRDLLRIIPSLTDPTPIIDLIVQYAKKIAKTSNPFVRFILKHIQDYIDPEVFQPVINHLLLIRSEQVIDWLGNWGKTLDNPSSPVKILFSVDRELSSHYSLRYNIENAIKTIFLNRRSLSLEIITILSHYLREMMYSSNYLALTAINGIGSTVEPHLELIPLIEDLMMNTSYPRIEQLAIKCLRNLGRQLPESKYAQLLTRVLHRVESFEFSRKSKQGIDNDWVNGIINHAESIESIGFLNWVAVLNEEDHKRIISLLSDIIHGNSEVLDGFDLQGSHIGSVYHIQQSAIKALEAYGKGLKDPTPVIKLLKMFKGRLNVDQALSQLQNEND